ncbi:MAG: M23 family metallopeptidase [candidate division WOR-3 bacterium]
MIGFWFASLVSASALSQPLALDSFRITSSFGEYRHLHFHAGFDYSTWGQTGIPVLALDDGVLFRASFSPWGYGKSLWLMTEGGLIVRYAHLERFTPHIDSVIHLYRKERKADTGTIDLALRVKKGAVVAYSGETGAGPPHLHLEIYDSAGRLLNPWDLGLRYTDTVPPTIKGISAVPMGGTVGGLPFERFYPSSGSSIPETIRVFGRFGLLLWAQDFWGSGVGIRGARISVDDTVVFSLDFASLQPEDNPWTEALYAFGGGSNSASALRCYLLSPKEELDCLRALPYLELSEGTHLGLAEAWDCTGARTSVRFVIKVGPSPPDPRPPLSWDMRRNGFCMRAFGYGTLVLSRDEIKGLKSIAITDAGYLYWIKGDTALELWNARLVTRTIGPQGGEAEAFGWRLKAPAMALACSTQFVFYRDTKGTAIFPAYPPVAARCTLALSEPDSLGIYTADSGGKPLRYLGLGEGAPASRFGFLVASRDRKPPEIKSISAGSRLIDFSVRDEGSGIKEISFFVDGEWVPGDHDPERARYSYRPLFPLMPGDHPWRITAKDAFENETSLEGVLRVK